MAPEGSQPSGSLSASVGLGWAGGGAWVPPFVPARPEDGRQWGSQRGLGCSRFRAMEKRVFSSFLSQDACLQPGTCSQARERLTWGCDRTEDTMKPLRSAEPGLRRARAQSPPDTCGKEAVRTRVMSILDYPARVGLFGATCSQLPHGTQDSAVSSAEGPRAVLWAPWASLLRWLLPGRHRCGPCWGSGVWWGAGGPRVLPGKPGARDRVPQGGLPCGAFSLYPGECTCLQHTAFHLRDRGPVCRPGVGTRVARVPAAEPVPHPTLWALRPGVTFRGSGPGPGISARRTPGPPHPLHLAAVGAAG